MNTKIICVLLLLALSARALADDRHHDDHDDHGQGNHDNHGGKCMECKNCRHNDNWCYGNCKRDCRQEGGIDIEKCKRYGTDVGYNAAKTACDLTTTFCKGTQRGFGAPQRSKVSLAQCGNAAYGVCQNMAMERYKSPCGWAFDRGMHNCNKETFWNFYKGVAEGECNAATAKFD